MKELLTYCKRFHLLRSKHGTGKKGKERKYSVSVMHAIGKAQPPLRIRQQY